MDLLLTLCGSIVLIFTIVLISRRKKSPSYPSGPIGLPWLGNILQIDPFTPHISITNLAKKYGDLYSISMLGMDIIVVSGSRFIKQVLRSPHLSGRPYLFRSMVLTDSRYNVGLMSPSTRWRQMKQCEVAALALQGEGLLKLERICTDILMDMTGEIQIHQGQPFQPYQLVRKSMVNILSSLMYGTKLEESELTELLDIENELTRAVAPTGNGVELDIIPWLRYVYSKNYDNLVALRNKMMTWFDKMIQKREAAMDLCDNQAQCAVDVMLSFARGQWHNHGQLSLSRDDVIMMNTDLIFAGTATTTVTLHVFLALMATRTDVQEKLHFEVTTILGGRNPSLADRKQIPYCNAVFHELLRYLSHAPIGLPHLAVEDTYIDQYLIPKNTQIWVNFWALHHEEKHWENPWLFNPDRFLDESGQLLPGKAGIWKNFVPFGLGKRACLGEALAINRLFLSMTTLVQRFKFSAAEGYPLPDVDPRNFELGVVLKPPDYFIVAKARHL